jgi:hypothetical protein
MKCAAQWKGAACRGDSERRDGGESCPVEESIAMPDLAMPVFNCEPVTSLVGNMLFPNDAGEAMAAAAWHLDGAILNAPSDALHGMDESRF